MASNKNVQVLVVGAGPTGLLMASELRRHGLSCRIIDKSPHATEKSKALTLHARTLELLYNLGLTEKAISRGFKCHGTNMLAGGKPLVHLSFDELESPYPFILCIPQSETEKLLTEHLESFGTKIERPVEMIKFAQSKDKITATLRHADGSEETVEADWLVGCDGAHSTTRHTLGFSFEGSQYPQLFLVADVKVDWSNPEDEMYAYLTEEGAGAVFFPFGNHRYRIISEAPSDWQDHREPTLEEMQAIVEKSGCPKGIKLSDPHWLTVFRLHRRSVESYRNQRVFLAGDASHIHSPFGGQGMNTGMHDAHNLAWKLALVAKGAAPESLLDSYTTERHAVGKALLHGTDFATKAATMRNPIGQHVRNTIAPILISTEVIQHRVRKIATMVAVDYRHSPIVGQYQAAITRIRKIHPGDGVTPDLASWLEFGHGPGPGDRAPDGALLKAGDELNTRVFDVLRGTGHTLLLFTGLKPSAAVVDSLKDIAKKVTADFGNHIQVRYIVEGANVPEGLKSQPDVYLDPDHSVHHLYGASSECLYLVRPDSWIGFRSQPADWAHLSEYLGHILLKQPAGVS